MYAETKRLFRSKGFFLTMLVYFLTFCFSLYLQIQSQTTGTFGFIDIGFVKEAGLMLTVNHKITTLNEIVQLLGLNYGLIIFGIYFTIFVCDEFTSGYIKNMILLPNGRYTIVLAKTWITTLYAFLFVLCNYVISVGLGFLCVDEFTLGSMQEILPPAVVMFLISFALFSLISFLSILTHNKLFGAVLVFLISSGTLMGIIYPLISTLSLFNFSEYTLSFFCSTIIPSSGELYIRMIIVSFLYVVVYNILSILSLFKQEI